MRSVPHNLAWTAEQRDSFKPLHYDPTLCWLDTRSADQFCQVRFERAFPWQLSLNPNCLNQLPNREQPLGLIADVQSVLIYQAWLAEKGYQLQAWLSPEQFLQFDSGQWPMVSGPQTRRLWQANPFLIEQLANALLFPQVISSDRGSARLALDLGCGGGREAVYLAKQGWQVVAVDNQVPALGCAMDLARAEQVLVDFRLADLTKPCERPSETFDVIYQLRFLDRNLFDYIETQLKPGGYVLIETFAEGVQAFGSPKNRKFILQPGELAQRFAHFDIIVDKLVTLSDGRPMNAFLARKPTYKSRSEYDESKEQ